MVRRKKQQTQQCTQNNLHANSRATGHMGHTLGECVHLRPCDGSAPSALGQAWVETGVQEGGIGRVNKAHRMGKKATHLFEPHKKPN